MIFFVRSIDVALLESVDYRIIEDQVNIIRTTGGIFILVFDQWSNGILVNLDEQAVAFLTLKFQKLKTMIEIRNSEYRTLRKYYRSPFSDERYPEIEEFGKFERMSRR